MSVSCTASNRVDSGVKDPTTGIKYDKELAMGVCLLVLLAYCTATVFVNAAWPLQSFQIGIFALLAGYLLTGVHQGKERFATGFGPSLVYFIPAWGLIQIFAHTTASIIETREAVLRWGSLAAVFFLIQVVASTPRACETVLRAYLCFATVMAVLCLAQLFTSGGQVLWVFSTGYPDVYASFPSPNNFAQFIELALPVAMWFALREGRLCWEYILVVGTLYASVIGAASRAGTFLCTAELLASLAIAAVLRRRFNQKARGRSIAFVLAALPIIAAIFTLVVGWQRVWHRFQEHDPYLVRREFLIPTLDMAKDRPLIGYGLGAFPEVYPQYAIVDFPFSVNHAHCDWAEFAAEGGIPFLLLLLIPFAAVVPVAVRHPWGLGVIAVMLHGCVDFPFPRPAVSGWLFLMLGLLYTAKASGKSATPAPAPAEMA
jgi:hypothetical protein